MKITLQQQQINDAKVSFACRRVDLEKAKLLIREPYRPHPGDVVLAKIDKIGQHQRIELVDGRRASLAPGDLIVLAYGNRYAPDQFEGLVPHNLSTCDMVAAGGLAATATTQHSRMKEATQIRPLGVLADGKGKAINLSDFSLPESSSPKAKQVPLFISCGTSMNSGKTHTACSLIRGFTAMGYSVGAVKLTGTGAGGDLWRMTDSGAQRVLDFTDAGLPSTYLANQSTLITTAKTLLNNIAKENVDVIVAEIADGVSHPETCFLLQSELIKSKVDGIFFAAADALGAYAGYNWLQEQQLPVLGVSGSLTLSPLAMRELQALIPSDPITAEELSSPMSLQAILPKKFFQHFQTEKKAESPAIATAKIVAKQSELTQVCGHTA
ncbi:hypothetical protein [Agarilytica rhodophyticola]|uniref:hypothetical protein n=1 Tax=Agarilytica rhodophyticola TaxID=1737490 RepID=UPI000B341409|nr:hypothetical protein [Agarilytica rhodophyticola]